MKEDRYSPDEHGVLVEDVGPWAKDKLNILTRYIQASGAARRRYLGTGAAYIDVFSGPGRSRIRDTNEYIDGSAIAAYKKAEGSLARFTSINISDAEPQLLAASEARLKSLGAPVHALPGPASVALPAIVREVSADGLHFAFLDPHNLGTLSFDLFDALATLKRIDVIVHVSLSDLQRNADRYSSKAHDEFDAFAPGWRNTISIDCNQERLRASIIEYWSKKVEQIGLPRAGHCELITGTNNQRLYWLIFLSKHPLAHKLWSAISSLAKSPQLAF